MILPLCANGQSRLDLNSNTEHDNDTQYRYLAKPKLRCNSMRKLKAMRATNELVALI